MPSLGRVLHQARVTCSDSGLMTRDTFVEYINHFMNNIKPTKQDPVLLILDGHSSHT